MIILLLVVCVLVALFYIVDRATKTPAKPPAPETKKPDVTKADVKPVAETAPAKKDAAKEIVKETAAIKEKREYNEGVRTYLEQNDRYAYEARSDDDDIADAKLREERNIKQHEYRNRIGNYYKNRWGSDEQNMVNTIETPDDVEEEESGKSREKDFELSRDDIKKLLAFKNLFDKKGEE
jgi:hypothetical protein